MKKSILAVLLALSLLLSGCAHAQPPTPDGARYALSITDPSEENSPMPPGRHFYVSGGIQVDGGEGVPADAQVVVRMLDESGEEVRSVRSVAKGTSQLWAFHESFTYDYPDDPDRKACVADGSPELVVKDMSSPMASFTDSSIKCTFTDDGFRALIVYATDAARGLIQDDGVGFTAADGSPLDALPQGRYLIEVALLDAKGGVLATAQKEMTIADPSDSVIGRFHPEEHYQRLLEWYKSKDLAINIDWIPGFIPTDDGVVSGFRAMFANNDIAVYSHSKTHMLVYLIEPASSSNRLELAYLQYARRVGSALTFQAYHYDIGEPVLCLPNAEGEDKQGTIVPFAEGDYLDICRVDEVSDGATDAVYVLEGIYTEAAHTDLSQTVVVDADKKFAVSGALAPFQVDSADVSQTADGLYELTNKPDMLKYTFDDGETRESCWKSAVMTRNNYQKRASAFVCLYEFYNVFGAKTLKAGTTYTVTVQAYDDHGNAIEGASEVFSILAR